MQFVVATFASLAGASVAGASLGKVSGHASMTLDRPNIFFMLTDDQDSMLGSMEGMPFMRSLAQTGVNLTNFFAHTPVCCPSRSELLTGRYFHNLRDASYNTSMNTTGEEDAPNDCMHVNATMNHGFERLTFANALQRANYRTGMFGKYLNEGGMHHICGDVHHEWHVPVGWTDFMGACPDTCYVDCAFNVNGTKTKFNDPAFPRGSNYGTSLIGNASIAFAEAAMQAGQPFFAYVASHAPHGPATPAKWYEHLYEDSSAPRTPAYNVHSPDKHWVVATQPKITRAYEESKIDPFFRDRLRSLRSVDDVVHAAHTLVASYGQLSRTYFVFTSDHGLHMGQYRLGPCKRQPYDLDLRVPALFIGPGISPGRLEAVAGIADLAPTFLSLAAAEAEAEADGQQGMDGRSLVPLLMPSTDLVESHASFKSPSSQWRTSYLVEYFATTTTTSGKDHLKDSSNNTFIGLRVLNSSYDLAYFEFSDVATDYAFEHANFCELYNLTADPHQLVNLCVAPPGSSEPPRQALRAALRDELYEQWGCRGPSCA